MNFGALPTEVIPEDLPHEKTGAITIPFPRVWIAGRPFSRGDCQRVRSRAVGAGPIPERGAIPREAAWRRRFWFGVCFAAGALLCLRISGPLSWSTVHKAAVAPTGWKELGGDPAWGNFKLVVPSSGQSVLAGLAAVVTAAGEYFDKNRGLSWKTLSTLGSESWLTELMGAASAIQRRSHEYGREGRPVRLYGRRWRAVPGKRLAFRYMEGIQKRWQEPIVPSLSESDYLVRFSLRRSGQAQRHQRFKRTQRLEFQLFLLSEGATAQSARIWAASSRCQPYRSDAADGKPLSMQWRRYGSRG